MTARCARYMSALKMFGSPWLCPMVTFPEVFKGLFFWSFLWMCVQNLKFVALPIPEIIGGTLKHWALGSAWIRTRSLFSNILKASYEAAWSTADSLHYTAAMPPATTDQQQPGTNKKHKPLLPELWYRQDLTHGDFTHLHCKVLCYLSGSYSHLIWPALFGGTMLTKYIQ